MIDLFCPLCGHKLKDDECDCGYKMKDKAIYENLVTGEIRFQAKGFRPKKEGQ